MPDNEPISIGALARGTGVATSALRYYDRIGLLPADGRTGRVRVYSRDSLERVGLIRLYQEVGFTLGEISRLLAEESWHRREWCELGEDKLAVLDLRIADARRAKALIERALACPHRRPLACPSVVAAIEEHAS